MNALPDFPVDDATLDLLWGALHPGPDAERTSLWDFLRMMSEMGGSDPFAQVEMVDGGEALRDWQYTDHCVISALIMEVRRLRAEGRSDD